MLGWWEAGIPAAVAVSGPRFLPTMIQLLLFFGGSFGFGLYFGRFWLARSLQNKDTEISVKDSMIAERELIAERLQQIIDTAPTIEEAQEDAKEIELMKPQEMSSKLLFDKLNTKSPRAEVWQEMASAVVIAAENFRISLSINNTKRLKELTSASPDIVDREKIVELKTFSQSLLRGIKKKTDYAGLLEALPKSPYNPRATGLSKEAEELLKAQFGEEDLPSPQVP